MCEPHFLALPRPSLSLVPALTQPASPGDAATAPLDAATSILEPLAGLLLSLEIRFAQAEALLKAAYIQASARAYAAEGKVPSVSTLSVATGIRRREVKRLLELPTTKAAPSTSQMSPASQARLRWTTDPRFLDRQGQPLPLARTSAGRGKSFASLAATISKDTHPRALLDELVRIGAAAVESDMVVLQHRFLTPQRDLKSTLEIGSTNVGDHLSTVLVNLLSDDTPLMERAVFADGLTESSARAGASLAREVWQQALPGLRERLQALVDQDEAAPDNTWRMRIGIYGYLAPTERPDAPVSARANKTAARKRAAAPRRTKV